MGDDEIVDDWAAEVTFWVARAMFLLTIVYSSPLRLIRSTRVFATSSFRM